MRAPKSPRNCTFGLNQWCVPLWRGTAPTEGRLDECRRLNDEVQTIGRNANSDNAAMLVQSQRLCVLLEAGQTEEALILCEHKFPQARFPAAPPWMTKLLARTGRTIEANGLLDRLVSTDFTDISDDAQWSAASPRLPRLARSATPSRRPR
jgi:hypothetical protein